MWLWEGVETSQKWGERRLSSGVRRLWLRYMRIEGESRRTLDAEVRVEAGVSALGVEVFGGWVERENEVRVELLILREW